MKLQSLSVDNFGHFQNYNLSLAGGLNIFLGPNEAGKSTLARFISYVLFEPSRRYNGFIDGARDAGHLTFDNGLTIARQHKTLTKSPSVQSQEALLNQLGVSQEIFDSVFSFSLDELREYSELKAEDAFTGALTGSFAAIKKARSVLAGRREEIWTARSRKRDLDELTKQRNELLDAIRQAQRQLASFETYERRLQELDEERRTAREEAKRFQARAGFWRSLRNVYATYRDFEKVMTELGELPTHHDLPNGFAESLLDVHSRIDALHGDLNTHRDRVARLRGEIEAHEYDLLVYERRKDVARWHTRLLTLEEEILPERRHRLRESEAAFEKARNEAGISSEVAIVPLAEPVRARVLEAAASSREARDWNRQVELAQHDRSRAEEALRARREERDAIALDTAAEEVSTELDRLERDAPEYAGDRDELAPLVADIDGLERELERNPLPAGYQPLESALADELKREADQIHEALREARSEMRRASDDIQRIEVPDVELHLATPELHRLGQELQRESESYRSALKDRADSADALAKLHAEIARHVELLGDAFTASSVAAIDLTPSKAAEIARAENVLKDALNRVRDLERGLDDAPSEVTDDEVSRVRSRLGGLKALEKTLVETNAGGPKIAVPGWFVALRWLAPIAFIAIGVALFAVGVIWAGIVLVLLAVGLLVALTRLQRALESGGGTAVGAEVVAAMKSHGFSSNAGVIEVRSELEAAVQDLQRLEAAKARYEEWQGRVNEGDRLRELAQNAEFAWRLELQKAKVPGADGLSLEAWIEFVGPLKEIAKLEGARAARAEALGSDEEKAASFQQKYAPLSATTGIDVATPDDVLSLRSHVDVELDAIARRSSAERERERLDDELERASLSLRKVEARRVEFVEKWRRLGLPETALEDVRGRLGELEQAWQNHLRLDEKRISHGRLTKRVSRYEHLLQEVLGALGLDAEIGNLAAARERVDGANNARLAWRELDERVREAARDVELAKERCDELDAGAERGDVPPDRWDDVLTEFPLLVNAPPDRAEAALNHWATVYQASHQAHIDRLEFDQTMSEYGTIDGSFKELHARLSEAEDFASWRSGLDTLLEETEKNATVSLRAQGELNAAENDIRSLEETLLEAREAMQGLLSGVGLEDFDDAQAVIATERRRAELQQKASGFEETLLGALGAAWANPDTREELSRGEVARWDAESEHASREAEAAEETADAKSEEYGRLEAEFEELKESGTLAELMVDQEALEARILKLQEEYTELVLALHLLESAVQTFKDEHQPAVMDLANTFVRDATGGLYEGLEISDDGREIFLRDATGRYRSENGLSRGTRELIFIILRLALATDYQVNRGASAPLIMDDILVNQDDERMAQIARLIVEASRDLQILFFTCRPETQALLSSVAVEASRNDSRIPEPRSIEMKRYNGRELPAVGHAVVDGLSMASDESEPDLSRKIYEVLLKSDEELGKNDILEQLRLEDDSGWNSAISQLKDDGYVEQIGERRGARYRPA